MLLLSRDLLGRLREFGAGGFELPYGAVEICLNLVAFCGRRGNLRLDGLKLARSCNDLIELAPNPLKRPLRLCKLILQIGLAPL